MTRMKCERAVHDILPVSRAVIAEKLVEVYGFSQTKASRCMGISQPAVSQYVKKIRGKKEFEFTKEPGYISLVNDVAKGLAEGTISPGNIDNEMCRICREIQGEC
jgi:predicted transcriptional regulator